MCIYLYTMFENEIPILFWENYEKGRGRNIPSLEGGSCVGYERYNWWRKSANKCTEYSLYQFLTWYQPNHGPFLHLIAAFSIRPHTCLIMSTTTNSVILLTLIPTEISPLFTFPTHWNSLTPTISVGRHKLKPLSVA